MTNSNGPTAKDDEAIRRDLTRMTRRGLLYGGAASLAGFLGWKWVGSARPEGLTPWPLRRVLEFDEKVGRAFFDAKRLARTFPASLVRMPRVNGRVGIDTRLDLDRWRLRVEGPAGSRTLSLDEIRALPRFETTTELKCIEGWSVVVRWAGARLADLATTTGLANRGGKSVEPIADSADLLPFVALETPNAKYYVGLDIASALHPQTLLCYEMNGEPLTREHGAPLRLSIPVKYGIKSLKQIGSLKFTEKQPADYWAEKGYDWFAGH